MKAFVEDTQLAVVNLLLKVPIRSFRTLVLVKLLGWRIGRDVSIGRGVTIPELWGVGVTIGDRVVVGPNVHMDSRGGITIGNDVDIASRVTFLTGEHDPDTAEHKYRARPIVVGDHCWVATAAMVLPGTTMEDGAVLGAGAVGRGLLGSSGIYAGNPARLVRQRAAGAQAGMKQYRRYWQ